jgi:DnaB-like helicase C terminal domain
MSSNVKFQLKLLDNLKLFRDRVTDERIQRISQSSECLSFGVKFLDECLGGIYSNDLIIYGAKTGIGKTQLATITAMANASAGKRVHFFALEAEANEIERRIKYQILAEAFFKHLKKDFPTVHLNYMDWYYGKLDQSLGKVEPEIDAMMKDLYPNLWTFYRTGDFTVQDFEKQILAIQDQTDLVIVDHLHYFDFEDDNENRAMKATVKKIRDLALLIGKPVILIAHMRKSDRRAKQVVPGADEFHGSSDITKIATKVVTLAPCLESEGRGNRWPTYIRAVKCRVDGARTKYVGLTSFNADTNTYERKYYLGKLNPSEEAYQAVEAEENLPYWAKSGQQTPGGEPQEIHGH